MNPNLRNERIPYEKRENVLEKTKDLAEHLGDKTKEFFTGETPVEQHEKNIIKEHEKFEEKAHRNLDDPIKINKEAARRDYNIAKEEDKLNREHKYR